MEKMNGKNSAAENMAGPCSYPWGELSVTSVVFNINWYTVQLDQHF